MKYFISNVMFFLGSVIGLFLLPLIIISYGDVCTMDAADNYSLSLIAGLLFFSLSSLLMFFSKEKIGKLKFISFGNIIVFVIYVIYCIPYLYYTNIKGYHLCGISLDYFSEYFFNQISGRGEADDWQYLFAPLMLIYSFFPAYLGFLTIKKTDD